MAEPELKLLEFIGRALDYDFGLNLVPFNKNHKVNSNKFRDTEAECRWKAWILDTYESQKRYLCKRPRVAPNAAESFHQIGPSEKNVLSPFRAGHQIRRLEDEVASGEKVQVETWSQNSRTCGKKGRLRTMRLICFQRKEKGW